MTTRIIAVFILSLNGFLGTASLVGQHVAVVDLLPGHWIVGEQNRYGDVVPARAESYGDRSSMDLFWDGRVNYVSAPAQGLRFKLSGNWEYFPRERLLVLEYQSRRGNNGYREFEQSFPPRRKTYYVERINRSELILRSLDGGRNFALMFGKPFSQTRRR